MNCLMINGSARSAGNSALALDYLQELLGQERVERIDLAGMNIGTCRGCRLCFDAGENACPHKDDIQGIFEKMKASDLLVVCGPIYVEDVNGIMKNWIDRMAFNCHRPGLYAQNAYILLHSGGGASNHALKTVERAFLLWGIRVLKKKKLVLGARMEKEEFMRIYGRRLKDDLESAVKKASERNDPSFMQIMTYEIQKWYYKNKASKDSYDYQYWYDSGWLADSRDYYSDGKIGILKKIATKIVGNIVVKLVLR